MKPAILLVLGIAGFWPAAGLAQSNPAATVTVNAAAGRHPINPLIYGVAWATAADLNALNAPLNRGGGTPSSTYNWKANAENLSDDWYFESYPQDGIAAGALYDGLIAASRSAGALPMATVPLIGWVAKLGADRAVLPSFSVKKYGAQCSTDPYDADAGDGIRPDCATHLGGNDPNDAYVRDSLASERDWVRHLVAKWHGAARGGLGYYVMDNESSIWFGDHWDVHPIGPHAAEIRDDVIDYSAMIKAIDPNALVVGPEEYGWFGYHFSGYDQQWLAANHDDVSKAPDRNKVMGGMDYIPWLLKEWKATRRHPLDVLSVHFYPLGGEYGDDDSQATQLLRNRSTRQFWDPRYSPPYWPNIPIALIPLLKKWVAANYYPNTPVAVTEYNWGGESHINGATAQADIYGIFGREALDMATRWTVPAADTPTYKAMQMYRNYDGRHSTFGDTGVTTAAQNPDDLSAFGAIRSSDGALTVMLVNKDLEGKTPVTVKVSNFAGTGVARAYQLTAANAIERLADRHLIGTTLKLTLPAPSVTLLVLPAAGSAMRER
jgi:hypothetical protein